MGDFNATGSLPSALRGMKSFSCTNPDQFDDWYQKACSTLSIVRPDVFHILEGQARPSITIMRSAASSQESLELRQFAYDRANQYVFAILYLIAEEPAALLVTKRAEGARGTRGNGSRVVKGLESKYLKITNQGLTLFECCVACPWYHPCHSTMASPRHPMAWHRIPWRRGGCRGMQWVVPWQPPRQPPRTCLRILHY